MSISDFIDHLTDPAPGFLCKLSGEGEPALRWTAAVEHRCKPPAHASDIAMLRELLGPVAASFESLYQAHNGCLLYEDTQPMHFVLAPDSEIRSDFAAGVEFYPIPEWQSRSAEAREEGFSQIWEPEQMAIWFDPRQIFGEICHSGNYLAAAISGRDTGKIFCLQHDPFIDGPIADSFEGLLDRIATDPAAFLDDMGCYTRYSDGQVDDRGVTNNQWIPIEYIPDVGST